MPFVMLTGPVILLPAQPVPTEQHVAGRGGDGDRPGDRRTAERQPGAPVALIGPVTMPPLIQSAPPAWTVTGPVSFPPDETQTDWPLATLNGPVLLVVMHAWVKTTEIVVVPLRSCSARCRSA